MADPARVLGLLRSRTAGRRRFLATGAAGVASLAALPALPLTAAAAGERSCCSPRVAAPQNLRPVSLGDAAEGNARAIALARRSRFIMQTDEAVRRLASEIPAPDIRGATLALLENPAPTYQLRSPTDADREAVREELLAAGLIPAATTLAGILPPVADAHQAPQPFWAAPGSGFSAHHAYPGGLAVHELVFTRMGLQYRDTYDALYRLDTVPGATDLTRLIGASLWHDVQKVTVFQWNPDGSEFAEQTIADTGAHHTIGGAEAIVRGMDPAWVTAQLSAHDAPTNVQSTPGQTGRQRLVNYIRAAAIIARVDAVEHGLLRQTADGGYALARETPRIEDYIIHFADQDYLLTNDAVQSLIATLSGIAGSYGITHTTEPARFNLFRNLVFSHLSDVRLYAVFQEGGVDAVRAMISREVDLSQLRE